MRRAVPFVVVAVLLALGLLAWRTDAFGLLGSGSSDAAVKPDPEAEDLSRASRLESSARPVDPNVDPKTFEGDPVGVTDLRLGKAAVTGRVTGAGNPLRFARVTIALPPPNDGFGVRTTKEGKFELRGLPAGAWDLRASAEGWRSRTVSTPEIAEGATVDVGAIDLKPAPAATDGLEVKVTDPAGKPIPGARVDATTLGYALYVSMGADRTGVTDTIAKQATTDDLGVARLFPLPAAKYDVVVRATGFALDAVPNVNVAWGKVERVHVQLEPGLTIQGTVIDAAGLPVKDAHVTAMQMNSFRSFETVPAGPDGSFTVGGLVAGRYFLVASSDEKGQAFEPGHKAGDRGVRLKLNGVGYVEGRVTTADGNPVPAFIVRPYNPSYFGYVYSQALPFKDPDGKFRLTLPPGGYQVDAKADGGAFVAGPKATVEVDKTAKLDIVLPAAGVVRGVVTDPDGNHLAGAEVFVNKQGFPPGPVREQYARTDAEGAFVLSTLPLEPIGLHVRHPGWALTVFQATPAPADKAKPVTIRMTAGARVSGHVLTPADEPVPGAQVNVVAGFDFFGGKSTQTDASGAYEFRALAAGHYEVNVGRFENGATGPRQGVDVREGGDHVLDFRAVRDPSATGSVTGRVTAAGSPVAGATVLAIDERGEDSAVRTKTDADGRYTATGLKAGRVVVTVQASGTQIDRSVRIDPPGSTATLDIALGTARVTGKIVGPDGRTAVTAAWVSLEASVSSGEGGWHDVKGWTQTDAGGGFAFQGLEPASFRLRASGQGLAARVTEPFSVGTGEAKDLGVVRLENGGVVSGRVTDDRGAAVEGIGVSLKNGRGESVFLFSIAGSGSDGRYSVESVELGTYTIRFEGKGYAPVEKPVEVTAAGATVDAVVSRGGSLTVRVENERAEPVAGARVELYDSRGQRLTKTLSIANLFDADVSKTSEAGTTTIPDLAPAPYTVRVVKEGMTLVGDPPVVSVASGATASARLVVRSAP
jgi:uncharacterized GH25 family protein